MQRKPQRSRLARLAVVSVLMMLAAWAVWPQVERHQQQRLALALVERMTAENCRTLLRRLTTMEPPAIEALVVAVAHSDTEVSQRARQAIDLQLGAWRYRREQDVHFEFHGRLNRLAAALAENVGQLGPQDRLWANRVAIELIELANELPPKQSVEVLAHCDRVLVAPPPQASLEQSLPAVNWSLAEELDGSHPSSQPQLELSAEPDELRIAAASPQPEYQSEEYFPEDDRPLAEEEVEVTPTGSDPRAAGRIARWSPTWVRQQSPTSSEGPELTHGKVDEARQVELALEVREVPSPDELESAREHLRVESTDELVKRLGEADFYTVGVIQQVLRERSVPESEWDLRARLLADDPDQRLRSIDELNSLPARKARLLLQRLLRDPDSRIRYQALSALATSGDPALFELAQDMALRDEDPTITELASRIVRELRLQ